MAPGLNLATFWTKDVAPKSSGRSEGPIGPAELGIVAAKKNAPQRVPNIAVFKRLLIFFSLNFKSMLKKLDRRGAASTAAFPANEAPWLRLSNVCEVPRRAMESNATIPWRWQARFSRSPFAGYRDALSVRIGDGRRRRA